MGKKIPIVSFLCGVFTGRKKAPPPNPVEEAQKPDDSSDSSTSGRGGDATHLADDATTKPISTRGAESPEQQQPLPPPPGAARHMRTVSCQHHRSNSGVSKLVSSLSLRVMGGGSGGGGGGGGGGAGRDEKPRHKDKKFKHEDSIWKKTIILGEKCRVPDEDDEDILYDEKGNKISTYHPKSHSGVLTYSRQTSCIDQEEISRK